MPFPGPVLDQWGVPPFEQNPTLFAHNVFAIFQAWYADGCMLFACLAKRGRAVRLRICDYTIKKKKRFSTMLILYAA